MIKNYFKIAFRNLWRNKGFSAINIFGLALGIATCLVIVLYVQNELSYDRYNKKADRTVRVIFKGIFQGEKLNESNVMPPTAMTIKKDFPEVQEATRLRDQGFPNIQYKDKKLKEQHFAFVDSNFFQVFTLPFLQGNAKTALLEPNTLIISKTLAQKYFGNEDPMGKVLNFKDQKTNFKITGVIDDVPENSHFHFDLFASMSGFPESREPSWMTSNFFTYLVLQQGYDYKKLEVKFPPFVEKYIGPQLQQAMGVSYADFRKKGNDLGFYLQPLTAIHLHSDFAYDLAPAGDIQYVYIFSAVAVFMLLIACINFMNLSTASASRRAREVGIRKVLGSMKWELVRQFLFESMLLTGMAMALAIGIVRLAMPLFNSLADKNLKLQVAGHPWLIPGLLIFGLLTAVLAGSYPAFYLSSFKPVSVLKGRFNPGGKSVGLRSGLVVFQFFISICLIVGTTVVYKQLAYIQNKKLGYNKEQVLIVQNTWALGKNQEAFRQQLFADPQVISVSNSGYLPAGPSSNNNFFVYAGTNTAQMVKTLRYDIDYDYIPTLGIELRTGRNFSRDFGADSSAVILNESAAKAMGWEKNPLGQTISSNNNKGAKSVFRVIGVVKDFHFKSLHERISPLVMVLSNENSGNLIVKTRTRQIAGLITAIKKAWNSYSIELPFSYSFLDERYNNTYRAEQKIGLILGIFAGLTIFVACLGLFGLARFTAEQRSKEIGIRKVLGATVSGIVRLLSRDFLKLVLIAFVLAAPLAWYAMNWWLQDFVYRIDISWWVFGLAAVLAILVTMATISFQAIKAAIVNPITSLRSE
jgi:putative ABC transport system permease protein